MGKTAIQWCDHSINPIRARDTARGAVGHYCQKISPGCANCYASTLQKRFNMPKFKGAGGSLDTIEPFLDESKLQQVLRRKKPTRYFWCDMSDLFGDWVPDEWIDKCFATMALTPRHTHQVLTKRPERMRQYVASRVSVGEDIFPATVRAAANAIAPNDIRLVRLNQWPLPNCWKGVSVEDQQRADERIPLLLQTPAAVRFLSVEPLLSDLDFSKHFRPLCPECGGSEWTWDQEDSGGWADPWCMTCKLRPNPGVKPKPGIDWCIIGGESGHHARACNLAWIRSLVAQCKAASVACFVKQLGAHPITPGGHNLSARLERLGLAAKEGYAMVSDPKGGDLDEFPPDLRIREFPHE